MYAYPTSFLMEKLKAGLVIFRAGRYRDNFSDLEGLWQPCNSWPFYNSVMSLNRFKLSLWCFCFDNCHTRDEQKLIDKFAAVSEMWGYFSLKCKMCLHSRGYITTVHEQVIGYCGRIPWCTYMASKP